MLQIFQLGLHFGKVWVSNHSSQAIMQLVPKDKRLSKLSPIAIMKAIKNNTEIQGMNNRCHHRVGKIMSKELVKCKHDTQDKLTEK